MITDLSNARHPEAMRDSLATVIATGDVPEAVRDEIGASWQRSSDTGLRPDHFDVPHDPAFDSDALLVRVARPVLDQLADDLVSTGMSVLLTDDHAHVLDRRAPEPGLENRLDGISLAPGFVYAEALIGTNAIGTALAQGGPSVVDGTEHFADVLTTMACAAAPVTDPRNGRTLGAVDLTCRADDASPLMLPLVARAARDIELRLVDDARVAERVLLQRFLRERRRAKGPLVFVNERTMITNAAADRLVQPGDEASLWAYAIRLLAGDEANASDLVLSSGAVVAVTGEPVLDGSILLGALLRLHTISPADTTSPTRGRADAPFGWDSLTDTEHSVIDLVAQGLTNRQVAERVLISRYTVDFHMRSIFRKLGVSSRVELTRVAVERVGEGLAQG